jgi:bifunctional non-homologous end joining protein LigD
MIELANKKSKKEKLTIEGKELEITNLEKVFWPEEGYTKGDLINYYIMISSYLLPYLKDRPESLHRYPNGIMGKSFYQKDMDHLPPDWIKTYLAKSEDDRQVNYMIVNDLASLIYMINLGCIDVNPWNSRTENPNNPDFIIIDLDPEDIDFKYVVKAALAVNETLKEYGIASYPKTSGATGLHIYIPVGAKYSYNQARNFAQIIVHLVHERVPAFTSLERSPRNRQGRVYLDWLQNSRGQTLAAPYCVRPRPGATVSAPLEWREVNEKLKPQYFTIKNIPDRLKEKGDIFKKILFSGERLENLLNRYQ